MVSLFVVGWLVCCVRDKNQKDNKERRTSSTYHNFAVDVAPHLKRFVGSTLFGQLGIQVVQKAGRRFGENARCL